MMNDAIEVLGWTLLHFVWQGAVVGVLAVAMLVALRRRSANARYLTAVSTLGLMLLLPISTIAWIKQTPPVGEVSPIFNTVSMIEIPRTREDGTLALGEPPIKVERIGVDFENPPPADAVPLIPVSDTGQTILEDLAEQRSWVGFESSLEPFIPWAVAAWLVGVGVLSLRLFASWWSVQRLRRRATQPADENWQAMLRRIAERLRVTRPVKLVESALVEVPTVIGWMKPIILLPASAMTGLTTEQLEALLAHELAHVRRHDYLVNLLQTVVETLLFYHPAVWWLSHRIRVEREHCCDDLAASVCGDRLSYAKALVAMEELRGPSLGLAMSARGGHLLSRIARLLGRTAPAESRSFWIIGAVLLAVVGMIGVAWAMQAEVDPDAREYSITLDNGVTVRLVAVCDLTLNQEKNWWRPNGAALNEPLKFIQVYGKGSRDIGSGREFALEIDGLSEGQNVRVLVNENGTSGMAEFREGSLSMRVTSNLQAFDGYFPVSTRRADLQVRLADRSWGPWQRIAPDGKRDLSAIPHELQSLYTEIELKQLLENGRLELAWQPRIDVRAQLDVRVVDVDDVIHHERAGHTGSWNGAEYGFVVPRNRVKWIEYRLLPFAREVTFKDVSLRPGLRTKVTMGETHLVANPSVSKPPAMTTHYVANWSVQFDSRLKGRLIETCQASRTHELSAGEIYLMKADLLREYVRQQLAESNPRTMLFEVLTWLRSPDEAGGHSSQSNSHLSLRADPGFDGIADLWGEYGLTTGESSGRFVINAKWLVKNPRGGEPTTRTETPLAFAADVQDGQAIAMILPLFEDRLSLVVAEYVRVPVNHWKEISRVRDAQGWLNSGPQMLLALGIGLQTSQKPPMEGSGRFVGRVRLMIDSEKPLPDLEKVQVPAGKVLDESLVFSKDGGLANVFVTLWMPKFPIEPATEAELAKPFVLIAEDGKFWPHAALLRVGRPVAFENRALESMNFRTQPIRNNPFNVLVKPADRFKAPAFEKSESTPFAVKNDIKPWMLAYLLPRDHPFSAITDDDGRFEINGLPPGEHEFRVWHERVGWLEKSLKITIQPGEEAESELEYAPDRLKLTEAEVLGWGNRQIDAQWIPRAMVPRPAVKQPKQEEEKKPDSAGQESGAGRGSPDPAQKPTEGLPERASDSQRGENAKSKDGNLRSNEAAGPGDPRRAQAIEQAAAFLKTQQQENGTWQGQPVDGVTALCAVALLQAGVKADDPVLQKALAHLRNVEPTLSYTVALQTMVFCWASPKEDAELIKRNVAWLEKAQVADGKSRGSWGYVVNPGGRGDGSCSRFAVLGLDAAKRAGFEVQEETWKRVSDYWLSSQKDQRGSGYGWGYVPDSGPTPTMTLAGIAALATANQHLPNDDQTKTREAAIRKPSEYLETMIPQLSQTGFAFYSLHSLERAGHLSGLKEFGKLDWKADAIKRLLEMQQANGSWKGNTQTESELIATSFALLVLTGQAEQNPDLPK